MDKSPRMCELRDKIAPWEAWIPRMSRSGWSPLRHDAGRQVCFLLNYMPGCQEFCGWFWGKALQDMEIRFIRERGLVSRRAIDGEAASDPTSQKRDAHPASKLAGDPEMWGTRA